MGNILHIFSFILTKSVKVDKYYLRFGDEEIEIQRGFGQVTQKVCCGGKYKQIIRFKSPKYETLWINVIINLSLN